MREDAILITIKKWCFFRYKIDIKMKYYHLNTQKRRNLLCNIYMNSIEMVFL